MTRHLRTFAARLAYEARGHIEIGRTQGSPSVAFLPNGAPDGSLRCYDVANQLRELGFRVLVVPRQLAVSQRRRLLARFRPDLVIVEKGRNPSHRRDLLSDWPYILDLDDADFLDLKLQEPMRELAEGAVGVIAGSNYIAEWADRWQSNVRVIWTGTPRVIRDCSAPSSRQPIVTWAQSDPLGYPRELEFLTDVITGVLRTRDRVRLRLYGWRAGYSPSALGALNDPRVDLDLRPPMPYAEFLESLCDVAVGLSPIIPQSEFSRGKSFGKILAYLEARVPTICSDEADHHIAFADGGAIVTNDPDVWIDSISRLLDDPAERDRIADEATVVLETHLTIQRASEKVADFVMKTLERRSQPQETLRQTQWSS